MLRESILGECPKCKSVNLDYGKIMEDDYGINYPITCKDCGFEGAECYDIEFLYYTNLKGEKV